MFSKVRHQSNGYFTAKIPVSQEQALLLASPYLIWAQPLSRPETYHRHHHPAIPFAQCIRIGLAPVEAQGWVTLARPTFAVNRIASRSWFGFYHLSAHRRAHGIL